MGGPGASVLLREPLTQEQTEELKAWIYSIGRNVEVSEEFPSVMEFWLKPASFSEEVSDCLFYFSVEDISEYTSESKRAELREQLGYLPPQKVGFSSGCNQEIDHRTLGLLILQLAERYQALIEMGGAITPPRKPNPARMEKVKEMLARSGERKAFVDARYKEVNKELEKTLPPGKTLRELQLELLHDPNSPYTHIHREADEKFGSLSALRDRAPLEEVSAFVHSLPGKVYEFPYMTANNELWVSHIVDITFLHAWLEHPHFHMIK